jgi:hypothetical protein
MFLSGVLVGCLGIETHSLVDGTWQLRTTRPDGTSVIEGDHADPRLNVDFIPSWVHEDRRLPPELSLWIEAEEIATGTTGTMARLTGTKRTTLVEKQAAACQSPDADCPETAPDKPIVPLVAHVCLGDEPIARAAMEVRRVPKRWDERRTTAIRTGE